MREEVIYQESFLRLKVIKIITIEQIGAKGIKMWGRDINGKLSTRNITNFKPYFYDHNKKKIIAESSHEVTELRKMFPFTYEADVNYTQRYLIDREQIPLEDEPIRVCHLDIETSPPTLDVESTPSAITIIVCYDTFMKRYVAFLWKKDLPVKVVKGEDTSIYYFDTEVKMLRKFKEFIMKTDPDMLTGFNVIKYDMKYIVNRMLKLGISPHEMCRAKSYVRFKYIPFKDYNECVMKGRVIFDLSYAYWRFHEGEMRFRSLDYIAKEEGFEPKLEVDLSTLWEDIPKLVEYCKHDVELCVQLDKKLRLIEFRNNLRKMSGTNWTGIWFNTLMFDSLILREARKREIILPSKPDKAEKARRFAERKKKKLKGAFVHETISGRHTGVIVFDLKSLYPSIMCQFNIGYDTINDNGKIKIKLPDNSIIRFTDTEGINKAIYTNLFKERALYKDKYKKAKSEKSDKESVYYNMQRAVKELMNSGYGYYGFVGSRVYDLRIANCITFLAREVIHWTIDLLIKNGYKIIYADTDSVFVKLGTTDLNIISKEVVKLEKIINGSYNEFVRKYGCEKNEWLKANFEKTYSKVYWGKAKKKYLGYIIYDDKGEVNPPRLDIWGFSLKRSDSTIFGGNCQKEILEKVLNGATKKDIQEYINGKLKEVHSIYDFSLIALPKKLKKRVSSYKTIGAHVRSVVWSRSNLGENILVGDKFHFIYGHVRGKLFTDVVAWKKKAPEGLVINWRKMDGLILLNALERLYEGLGWEEKSKSLESWMVKK